MKKPGYNDSVFINCPFDSDYQPILRSILYTVYRCGFFPRTSLEENNGAEYRLDTIIKKIRECRYGIHDLSRIELNQNGFPRFNMPFELGIFFGAKHLGDKNQRNKNALVLERTQYSVQQMVSDLNGIDAYAHRNRVPTAMHTVRDWLRTNSKRTTIPGHLTLDRQYLQFRRRLPAIADQLGFHVDEIPYSDLVNIIEDSVAEQLGQVN